ncbi:MAG: POTRA domain-containing protein [Planctomycetota bacterium]
MLTRQNRWKYRVYNAALAVVLFLVSGQHAMAQFGGGGMGAPGGGAGPAPVDEKPKFREHIFTEGGIAGRRETGDMLVADVIIRGNQRVSQALILQKLQTRRDRFYDQDIVLQDVKRLMDLGRFEHVTFDPQQVEGGMQVTFIVRERKMVTKVIYHGNRGINDRELGGRSGIQVNDALSKFAIENGRLRLVEYYREEGFNQATVEANVGLPASSDGRRPADPTAVIFRINEGPLERVRSIRIEGSTIVREGRLKTIIQSRGRRVGMINLGNKVNLRQIDEDVRRLETYYHNLGYLIAKVGRRMEYTEDGRRLDLTFVVEEGPRFSVRNVLIEGNQYIDEASLRSRLNLGPGDTFDGNLFDVDVGEITYGYGELGFIYAEVDATPVMLDQGNEVDLVYRIAEGDRWKVGSIRVHIDGEPHLMRESTMLNLIDLREGDFINRRFLELNVNRLKRSNLLETNPAVADPPDIVVRPLDGEVIR